jgi:hypothetical protein
MKLNKILIGLIILFSVITAYTIWRSATSLSCYSFNWENPKSSCSTNSHSIKNTPFKLIKPTRRIRRDIMKPTSIDLSKVDKSIQSSITFPLNINNDSGNLTLGMVIPLYDPYQKKVIYINSLLDTGSEAFVIPSNVCNNKYCIPDFGMWDGKRNCPVKDLVRPTVNFSYGSADVTTRRWRAPLLFDDNKKGVSIDFYGIISVESAGDIPYIPAICGLLPTYMGQVDTKSVSFIEQISNHIEGCKKCFIIDTTPKKESITFGKVNPDGVKIPMLNRIEYKKTGLTNTQIKPKGTYYITRLKGIFINNILYTRDFPSYAILDTGTSGYSFGPAASDPPLDNPDLIMEPTGQYETLIKAIKSATNLKFVLGNDDVNLRTYDNVENTFILEGNRELNSDDIATGLPIYKTMLIGLPGMLNTIISYDLDNNCIIFNKSNSNFSIPKCQNGDLNNEGICVCKGNFTGNNCQLCKDGYYGLDCSKQCNILTCTGNRECSLKGECVCRDDYYGENCDVKCDSKECNKNGKVCGPDGTCICKKGFYGEKCDKVCKDCDNGICDSDGKCKCKGRFSGEKCDKCDCKGNSYCDSNGNCSCKNGYYGKNCDVYCDSATCSGNTQCGPDGTCICKPGFYGKKCDVKCDPGLFGEKCDVKCDPGLFGEKCDVKCDSSTCTGNRVCDSLGQCICKDGFYGEKCDIICNKNNCSTGTCSFRGKCVY